MRLGDFDALKAEVALMFGDKTHITESVCELIDNAPSIPLPDFKEGYKQAIIDGKTNFSRPQGKWKLVKDRGNNIDAKCPFCEFAICGIAYNYSILEVKEFIKNKDFDFEFPKFCENCGADMRKGDTDCMDEDAKQASIPYTYNAPQHDWKCGYPDITRGKGDTE